MSWTADQIYTLPKPKIISLLKENPYFGNRLFGVTDLGGIRNDWTKNMMHSGDGRSHDLPKGGILAVAPHIYSTGHDKDRDTDKFWVEIAGNSTEKWSEIQTNHVEVKGLPENIPFTKSQLNLFGLLQILNKKTNIPLCYYKCEMWGGDIDEEYSVIFDNNTTTFINDVESKKTLEFNGGTIKEIDGTPLQLGLDRLGLILPTWFFALHEASFNWRPYQIR